MTDAPSWSRVKEVLQAALERPPAERIAFVRETCRDDVVVGTEVESLLSALEGAGSSGERARIPALSAGGAPGTSRLPGITQAALRAGDSLGPYKVLDLVGSGGMGQVYRARDAKLNRDVALKILPDAFDTDSDRLARFRREAQVLASLNHPNIGQIYGLEDGGDRHALVLELVEGPTLADVIAGKRHSTAPGARPPAVDEPEDKSRALTRYGLPIDEVLRLGLQITQALEAAHQRGVIHRDLKPANIKVRPDGLLKVLDFGLARALDATPSSSAEAMESPTITSPAAMTGAGMILGTAPYMSPEQARGTVVDKRADIWAFGCVLFEMLAGRRPFDGHTTSDTIAAILTREPDWTALPAATPAGVRELIQRCLEKDATRRLRDIGDARIEIEQLIIESRKGGPAELGGRRMRRWVALAAAVVLGAGAVFALLSLWRSRPIAPPQYTQITDFSDSATAPSLSPDGRMVTFIRGGTYFQSRGQIYVKPLPNGEAVRLTNDPRPKFGPVFTPDGSRIAYSVIDGDSWDTWTVPVLGGQPTRLLPNASALTWLPDGRVLFSEIKSGIHMGIVTATEVRAQSREIYFPEHERAMAHFSYASPDRKSVLIVEMGSGGGWTERCRLMPFDGSSRGRLVGPDGACRFAAWSPDGKWMYFGAIVNDRSDIWRQAFPNGEAEQITFDPTEKEGIAIAPDGNSLVTSVGGNRGDVWIHDEAGERQVTSEGFAWLPQFSRDGRHVFYLEGDQLRASRLRRVDLVSGTSDEVLPGLLMQGFDVSPDGTEVAFTTNRNGDLEIWLASLDRRSPPRQITRGGDQVSFGPNGTFLFRQRDRNANYLSRVNRDGSGREQLLDTPIVGKGGVSPDGAWVIVFRPTTTAGRTQGSGGDATETVAISLRGGPPRRLCAFNCLPGSTWTPDGRLYSFAPSRGRTAHLPVPPRQTLPDLPASGISSPDAVAKLPGVRLIEQPLASPGPLASTYVFVKTEIRRNLFRIQLR